MKRSLFIKLISALLLCVMFLSACGNTDTPETPAETKETNEQPSETGTVETNDKESETNDKESETTDMENDKFVQLSSIGESIYAKSYESMVNRLLPNGYAPTSINGAYSGMFVRDASIQVMSHIINGDMDMASSMLKFIAGTHIAMHAEYAIHIMNPLEAEEKVDYRGKVGDSVSSLSHGAALYLINRPVHACAQSFTAASNQIAEINVFLSTSGAGGSLVLGLGTDKDDESLGKVTIPITEATSGFITFKFETPVRVTSGQDYVFTVYATEDAKNVVAFGQTGTSTMPSYNYDSAAYNGWIQEKHTIGFEVRASAAGDEDAAPEAADIAYKTTTPGTVTFDAAAQGKYLADIIVYLSSEGEIAEGDTFTFTLKSGSNTVDSQTFSCQELNAGSAKAFKLQFHLPLFSLDSDDPYTLTLETSKPGSVAWYGTDENHLSYIAGVCTIQPLSRNIQVDGHYMLVNAYAMFALADDGTYADLVEELYPLMSGFADYFINSDRSDYLHDNNLLYNPSYEHSRKGRYWQDYDLITNCFASEALHKMSAVAKKLGEGADEEEFDTYADVIAAGVHQNLTSEINGKKIYTELIALDEDGKVYKGFSFVSLAPVACEWYAMDEEIMANTYAEYRRLGTERYGAYEMLPVVVELNDNDERVSSGNHVIGKGLAWELYYLWSTGNTERLTQMLRFIDTNSVTTYPEVWVKNGTISDNANQEHANWLIYMVAKISGKAKN